MIPAYQEQHAVITAVLMRLQRAFQDSKGINISADEVIAVNSLLMATLLKTDYVLKG